MQHKRRKAALRRKRQRELRRKRIAITIFILFIIGLVLAVFALRPAPQVESTPPAATAVATIVPESTEAAPEITKTPVITDAPEITPEPTVTPVPGMPEPAPISGTYVNDFGLQARVKVNETEPSVVTRPERLFFGDSSDYTALEGITTFRGNNYRDSSSYGTAEVVDKKLSVVWSTKTNSMGKWSGSGWTGQPLIVKWPESTRQIMNLNPSKRNKEGLVEVIYPMMGGYAYFLDLEDGEPTRDALKIDKFQSKVNAQTHLGGFSIDPRGYPLLYVGSGGDKTPGKDALSRFIVFSLIDFDRLLEFGKNDGFAPRQWVGWDCSALVDAATDTLIECGENGLIYTMKLNTRYDESAGKIAISPSDLVRFGYTTERSRKGIKMNPTKYWLGMESSCTIFQNYLYIADNGGNLICLNLDNMQVVWVQDTLDDTNCTPVFEQEADGRGYIYISTSFHAGWRKSGDSTVDIPLMKIDASTGEKIWERSYSCYTVADISGGTQATALVGKESISDLVYFSVSRTPKRSSGILVALDKNTGEEVWRFDMPAEKNGGYAWSSPTAIYTDDGEAYIIQCNSDSNVFLLDGKTGELLDKRSLGSGAIESTPAVFGDMIVVGTRGNRVFGIKIS